jgi:prepilin peptidase CpaA
MIPNLADTEFIPIWLLTPLLIFILASDILRMRIPNAYPILGLVLFFLTLPLLSADEVILRVAFGGMWFAVCIGLFAGGLFGGGDAKMLPVAAAFVPSALWSIYMLLLAGSAIMGLLIIRKLRRIPTSVTRRWVAVRAAHHYPLGVSIAVSGIAIAAVGAL